ncbi:hypothetical protein FXV83_16230 [Bradyrhizobium hipponense]|uniref:Uncharacterized protein n=1 Tax=Bradyrhizobium hipponense TaxID=2605638 RepID=A0A5S4YNM5_9BRAD|nr:hypothetical protein [Bradyrhizobium hipponense]TYO65482.1 hypothetical protein FXV83_16230 [Bradyrhizobium hipponense]
MRERLRALFCAYSTRTNRTPSQSAILMEAGSVVLSPRVQDQVIQATIEALEAAFENTPGRSEIRRRPIYSGNILEFPGGR